MGVQINGSTGAVTGTQSDWSGNVSIGGTLTYEDVTNIDAVGLITARTGIEFGARPGVAASISSDGNMIMSGISTIANLYVPDKIIHDGDTNTTIRFPAADTITAETAGSERLRIDSSGKIGLGINSPARMLHLHEFGGIEAEIHFSTSVTGTTASDGFRVGVNASEEAIVWNNENGIIKFGTANTERLRITSDGYVRIGGNEGNYPLVVIDESNRTTTADTQLHLYAKHDGSGTTGVGFGGGIRFWGDRASGNVEQNMGRIMCIADVNSGTTLSGAFVFETGVAGSLGEKLRISSSGYVTHPSKRSAAFCARQNTGNGSLSANDIVVLNKMDNNYLTFDPGSNYSTSTGKYTAPVAGVYWFEAQVMTTGWSNGNTTQDLLALQSNNGQISYPRDRRSTFDSSIDANGYFTNSVAGSALLAAGDTVWFTVTRACGVANVNYSYFQGHLVG